jgi:uncharacterized membrane protein YphA (DoxX/SURF4 family)
MAGWLVEVRRDNWFGDVGLLIARIALAWIFIYHGGAKLFGAFNGPGLHQTSIYFSQTAHLHPGGFFAVLGGLTEFLGGIGMALGLFGRLAGVAIAGDMIMAMITVTWVNGILSAKADSGYELNLGLVALALVITFLGSGRFSLDYLLARALATPSPGAVAMAPSGSPTTPAPSVVDDGPPAEPEHSLRS